MNNSNSITESIQNDDHFHRSSANNEFLNHKSDKYHFTRYIVFCAEEKLIVLSVAVLLLALMGFIKRKEKICLFKYFYKFLLSLA